MTVYECVMYVIGALAFVVGSAVIFFRTKTYRLTIKEAGMFDLLRCIAPQVVILLIANIWAVSMLVTINKEFSYQRDEVGLVGASVPDIGGFECGTERFKDHVKVSETETHHVIVRDYGGDGLVTVVVPKDLCQEITPE